jgi:peroxiredoxin
MPLILAGAALILLGISIRIILPNTQASPTDSPTTRGSSVIPGKADYPAPELDLMDTDGNPVTLADYRGQVVLVNNWATWCPPCKAEMPELEAYYLAHRNTGFTIIGIDAGDPAEEVKEFIDLNGISFPMWLDPDGQALRAFMNNGLPSSYVIDKTGTVRLAWTGGINQATLEKYVTPLLEE